MVVGCLVGGFLFAVAALVKASSVLNAGRERDKRLRKLADRLGALERATGTGKDILPEVTEPQPPPLPVAKPAATGVVSKATAVPVSPTPAGRAVKDWAASPPEARKQVKEVPGAETGGLPATPVEKKTGRGWARFEEIIGKRWLTWVGVLTLFFAMVFFVKHAIDVGFLGEKVRVGVGIGVGLLLMGLGVNFLRKLMRPLGMGLVGGGMGIIYVSLYAGFAFYGFLPWSAAFPAMALTALAGITLSVVFDAMPVSFLAVLCGFLTPALVTTGEDMHNVLFVYILILNLSVLGVAWFRRWRALDVLAFAGTVTLFTQWYAQFYSSATLVPAMAWLSGFYVVFLVLPFPLNWRKRRTLGGERFALAMMNAAGFALMAYRLLDPEHRVALGTVMVIISACYLGLGVAFRKRVPADRRGIFGFLALSMLFITLAVPLYFGLNGITLIWAAEAVVLLALGYRFNCLQVRVGGFVALCLAVCRVFLYHWPAHDGTFTYLLNRDFGVAAWALLACGAFAFAHEWWRKAARPPDRYLKLFVAHAAVLLAAALLHAETAEWFRLCVNSGSNAADYSLCAACVIWAVAALGYVAGGIGLRCAFSRILGLIGFLCMTVPVVALYEMKHPAGAWLFINWRFGACAFVVAAAFAAGFALRRFRARCSENEQQTAAYGYLAAAYCGLILVTAEVFSFSRTEWAWAGVTALWALGGLALAGNGLRRPAAWRGLTLGAMAAGTVIAALAYAVHWEAEAALCWNPRFGAAILMSGALFMQGWLHTRARCGDESANRRISCWVYWAGVAVLPVMLSLESYNYFSRQITDPEQAKWIAQASLSILWSVYAAVLLALGFWRRHGALRMVALGLFCLTGLKLALVDLWQLRQLARILSFFALGLLMILAAYCYHKLEQRLGNRE